MRVDPLGQLNELIASVFEAIAFPSLLVLAVALVVVVALELRSRTRGPERKSNARDRVTARHRKRPHRNDVAPATR